MAEQLTLAQISGVPVASLAGLPVRRAGAWLPDDEVHMRAWPWPYRSALALSNDCDSQSIDCMRDWHRFVNGSRATAYGDGLSLEVGDSFWIYGNGLEPAIWKGSPFDSHHDDGYALDSIVELGRAGFLDTLHSFGNWSARFIPSDRIDDATIQARDQILRGLDRLTELKLSPSVYVNHSGSPSNVGGPWGSYQRADVPDERLYALDALRSFGFRFFWLDATTDIEKFGNELVFVDKADLARAVERYSWGPWLRRKNADGQIVAIELPSDPAEVQAMMAAYFNRAIFPVTARDGQLIHAFKRYRDIDQPVGATFPSQVTTEKLDELERRCGSVVIYQHFGVFGPRGRMPAISRPHRKRSPIPALDRHSVATWQLIADRNHAGRLFVATQGRLLDWIWRRSSLQLSWTRDDSRLVVSLDCFSCPVEGTRPVSDDDLNGLAIVVPADAPEVIVTRPGRTGTITVERASDGANDVVFIPWQSLQWPDGF